MSSTNGAFLQKLIDAGAVIDALNAAGQMALHIAVESGQTHMTSVGQMIISQISQTDDVTLKELVRVGAPIDGNNARYQTPLHVAAANGHTETMRVRPSLL